MSTFSLGEGIFRGIGKGFGLVAGDILHAQVLEHLEEGLTPVSEGALLDQHMAIDLRRPAAPPGQDVYMYLKDRANRDGACWPGIKTIAKELGISQATVRRALRDLESGGWIVKTPRYRDNGSSTSNFYKVVQ